MKERLTADDRGVSEVVGAILIFGLLVLLLSILQTQVVPVQNQEIEVQHSQQVENDLTNWHEIASDVSARGSPQSASVSTGTNYPPRLLFINPPPVQGTLSTSDPSQEVEIENITASEPETRDYIDDDQNGELRLSTRTLEYEGNYNEYQNEPTVRYEYGLLYSQFEDDAVVANSGNIIDGTKINLIFLNGSYSRTSGGDQSVTVQPVSAPARSVTIDHNGTGDLNITLPSELSASKWRAEYNESDSVDNITKPSSDTVRIDLNESKTYNLRTSQIGLERDIESPKGYYIVPADDGTTSVGEGSTTNVKYEVRDRYNNPVSNVTVDISTPTAGTVEATTDRQGRVVVPVTPSNPGTQTVTAEIQSSDPNVASGCPSARCNADYTVQVTDLSINPNSGVRLEEVTIQTEPVTFQLPGLPGIPTPFTQSTEVVVAEFNSTDGTRTVEEIRVNVYAAAQQDDTEPAPDQVQMNNTSPSSVAIASMNVSGPFYSSSDPEWKNGPRQITQSSNEEYQFAFTQGGSPRDAESADFFVLTIVFQDGEQAVYFVSPD